MKRLCFLFFFVAFLPGCSLFEKEIEYKTVYVTPDLSKLKLYCSISTLDTPPTLEQLKSLKTYELRFIKMSEAYNQSLQSFGTCVQATNGVIQYVEQSAQQNEELP